MSLKLPLYTITTLSQALDVSQPQVSAWKTAGMPFSRNGRISMADAVRWLRDRAAKDRPRVGISEANERRMVADAELAELKLARERGDVTPTADVYASAEEEIIRFRTALTQMASAEAPFLASRMNCHHREAAAVLREIADRTLAGLSTDEAEEEAA